MAICPECEFDDLDADSLEEGEEMTCPECGQLLVLVGPDDLQIADEDDDLADEDGLAAVDDTEEDVDE